MRQVMLTIGLLLFAASFGRLTAQPYLLDPPTVTEEGTPPWSLPTSPPNRKLTARESEMEGEDDEPEAGFARPYSSLPYTPRFGGGMFQMPRMTREDIQRQRFEKAWRERLEFEKQAQKIREAMWTKEAVEAAVRGMQLDIFGEVDEIPTNLRIQTVTNSHTRTANKEEVVFEDNSVETKQPSPPPTPPPLVAVPTTPEKETQQQREEKERLAKLVEEAAEQREAARQAFLARQREAEQGAVLFELPENLQIPEQQLKAGLCHLFDGKTLFGWRIQKEGPYGGGNFFIDDQMICSDPERPGLLYTTNQFGDATFHIEYQAEESAEVFLLVRTSPNPRDLYSSCYAVVLNSADYQRPRGTILGRHTLSVDQIQKQEREARAAMAADNVPPSERWRKVTAQFEGGMLRISIDKDEAVTLYEAKPPGCGYLGILVTKGTAKFRNLTWIPGSSISLFDGINAWMEWRHHETVRWSPIPAPFSLQLSGGPGVVETKKTFDNFALQFEYNITHTFGRSGLFLRSTPREEKTGYEIAVQNMPTKEDRAGTVGVDVGSFRGVKNARFLRTNDQTWNYVTVLAVDRHFQTWVNGVSVCEWTVPVGQPLVTSGTLQFLAPTDATNVQFRNIRYTQILPRSEKPRTFDDRNQTTYTEITEQRKAAERERQLDEEMRKGGRE